MLATRIVADAPQWRGVRWGTLLVLRVLYHEGIYPPMPPTEPAP